MKFFINFIILVKFFTVCFASGDLGFLDPLQTIDTFMGLRQTNVGCHSTLYPHMNLALAVNCHPYNPNDVIGDKAFVCAAHPLVIKYNPELVKDFLPEMRDALYAGHVGNDGSAIEWGRELGAQLADLGGYQGHGSWAVPQGALISWALMMEGAIQINALGERFHDETQGYSEAAVQVLAQPHGLAWNIFDDTLLKFAQDFPDFSQAQSVGAVHSFQNMEELSKFVACPVDRLAKTLEKVHAGVDTQTGRIFKRSLSFPLHAIRVTGALFHTQGGLDIDAGCRVLRTDGSVFPNLLAAGGAARGVSGNAVWGYLSGNGLLSAIAGGYIAAHSAASGLRK